MPGHRARSFSDQPERVAAYARATVRAYKRGRMLSRRSTSPASAGRRSPPRRGPPRSGSRSTISPNATWFPFKAAIEAGAPAILIGHGLYATDDFVTPASLSKTVTTDLLRDTLGFKGVAITDDLSAPAVTAVETVPDAAVSAINAGADLLYISRPQGEQEAAYLAVLNAVRKGNIPRERIDEALLRALTAKRKLGLIAGRGG